MKKLIIRSNKWYDNLSEPFHTFVFLIAIILPCSISLYLDIVHDFRYTFPIWATLVFTWRGGYFWIKNNGIDTGP